jgi:hypothetical protein
MAPRIMITTSLDSCISVANAPLHEIWLERHIVERNLNHIKTQIVWTFSLRVYSTS